jgi:hypothetical protein
VPRDRLVIPRITPVIIVQIPKECNLNQHPGAALAARPRAVPRTVSRGTPGYVCVDCKIPGLIGDYLLDGDDLTHFSEDVKRGCACDCGEVHVGPAVGGDRTNDAIVAAVFATSLGVVAVAVTEVEGVDAGDLVGWWG